ncbi:MlaD family protein [Arsukibacterium sp.]|uniref:MlaD family protein n=1 Tax=Arsukibacterium sp. TaxID=1977258 RepID=UPI00299DFAE5|nr:MlaD family protein [Arsukibacterium sp.]MDX1536495.1 MlaD family protein [Arsukibacterium sp.]
METKANYIIVGAFTLLFALAAVLFGLFSAKYASDSAWQRYQVVFNQSVIGLANGSPVLYNGVNIGRVADISLNPGNVREVLVTVDITAKVPVYQDTVATIRLLGLTGNAAVQLKGGTPGSAVLATNPAEPGQIESVSSPLNTLLESSEGIVVTANKVLSQLDTLLSDSNIERINTTLGSLQRFSSLLAAPDSALNQLLTNSARASDGLPELLNQLSQITAKFDKVLTVVDQEFIEDLPELKHNLAGTLANLESLSGRLDTLVAGTEHQLSQFSGVGLRQLSAGLEDLRTLIRDLSRLVQQLENNPGQLLLGTEQPEVYGND